MQSVKQIIHDAQTAGTWLAYRRAASQLTGQIGKGEITLQASVKVAFLGSFTVDPLADFAVVYAADSSIGLHTYIAPYGQISQEILNPQSGLYAFAPDVTIVMTEPHTQAGTPQDAVNEIIKLSQVFKNNTSGILIICTFIAAPAWPLHILPLENEKHLKIANQYLLDHFAEDPRVQICDLDAITSYHGYRNALSPEMMAMARHPFSESFLPLLAQKLVSHIKADAGMIRKCLVLDCDNTLWGGIIGEDGMDGIALGPDWPGREYLNFQKAILELYEQGIILAINSKNNEADVLKVLREHPHMLLREDHFAAICVNWQPKPQNMQTLAETINIGLDTLVFVDDNPVERDLMRQMLPQVAVLDLPANPAHYEKTLRKCSFFAKASLTEEDRKRGQIYAAQRKRTELEKTSVTLEDFLKSLEMTCSIRPARQTDAKRIAQLTQRTNQFNLTTRRYTEAQIRQMLEDPDWAVYVLGLKDKFGDNGTVGLALVKTKAPNQTEAWNGSDMMPQTTAPNGSDGVNTGTSKSWHIDTFLMSCRVIGRQAEDALADRICADAQAAGVITLNAEYIKSPKNALTADFWPKMGFKKTGSTENREIYSLDVTAYTPQAFEYLKFE